MDSEVENRMRKGIKYRERESSQIVKDKEMSPYIISKRKNLLKMFNWI